MTREDYSKYYIQGSDHYLISKDIFNELFNEMENWKKESQKQKEFIEYLKSEIKRLEENNIYEPLQRTALATFQHVLSKYKEIIGDKDE